MDTTTSSAILLQQIKGCVGCCIKQLVKGLVGCYNKQLIKGCVGGDNKQQTKVCVGCHNKQLIGLTMRPNMETTTSSILLQQKQIKGRHRSRVNTDQV